MVSRTRNEITLVILMIGWILACASQGFAASDGMEFLHVPNVGIFAVGEIVEDTPKRFEEFVKTKDIRYGETIYLNSPGGHVGAGLQLGTMIRLMQLSTRVGNPRPGGQNEVIVEAGDCASACVFLFIGGTTRTMREQDRLGIHRMSMSGDTRVKPGEATEVTQGILSALFSYVKKMGVSPELVVASLDVQSWSLHYLTRQEMLTWGVVTGAAQPPQTYLPPQASGYDTVRSFYLALESGDGTRASSLIIPEKRGRGNFNPVAIRSFYSQNSLQLTDVLFWAENVYRAEYTLTTRTRRLKCVSLVSVVLRDGETLIERIKALNEC